MRTLIVTVIGLVLAFGFAYGAKALGKRPAVGLISFATVWLVFCAIDFALGVRAGYSASEELGIHLVLFTVPVLGAWAVGRFLLS